MERGAIKVYSPHRRHNIRLDFGDGYENVTHMGETGDYLIVDPTFFPSVGKDEIRKIIDHVRRANKFDILFLGELVPKIQPSRNSIVDNLENLDEQLINSTKEAIITLHDPSNQLVSTCMFWRKHEFQPKNPRAGCVYPPIFTHESINPVAKITDDIVTGKISSSVDGISSYVDELASKHSINMSEETKVQTINTIFEMSGAILSSLSEKQTLSGKTTQDSTEKLKSKKSTQSCDDESSSESPRSTRRNKKSYYNKSNDTKTQHFEESGGSEAAAVAVLAIVIIVVVIAVVCVRQNRYR